MKKLLFLASLAALLAASTACKKEKKATDRSTFQTGDTLLVKMGETVTLQPDGLEIRLDSITADSRCPQNALILCVWEGRADAKLTLILNSDSTTGTVGTLGYHGGPIDPLEALGFRIKMTDLDPYPLDVSPIPQAGYVARLLIEEI